MCSVLMPTSSLADSDEKQRQHQLFLHRLISLVLPGSAVFNRELQEFVWFISHIGH